MKARGINGAPGRRPGAAPKGHAVERVMGNLFRPSRAGALFYHRCQADFVVGSYPRSYPRSYPAG